MQVAPNKKISSAKQFTLDSTSYYTQEANEHYMSPTWFKKFLKCEAEALAELRGRWQSDMDNQALLVGNYLHSYFESPEAHQAFLDEHADKVFRDKARTHRYKAFSLADTMIKTLDDDKMFKELYVGDKESIVTGKIDGVDWMGKLDCLNLERGYFIDLKTTRKLDQKYWTHERKPVPFVYEYDYQLQMAVYRELVRQQYGVEVQPYIVAITKEDYPDKAVISIPEYRLDDAMIRIHEYQPHIEAVINGEESPVSCGTCDYCKDHKQLEDIIDADELLEDY